MVDLLGAYSSVLDLVAGHAVFDPREGRRFARMKPAIGVESYVIRHVRANADRFIRRYRLRQALCQDDEYDERDREALDNFSASLGPVNSRFWLLLPYLISLAVVQILISAGGKPGPSLALHDLIGLLSLNLQQVSTSADHLIRDDRHLAIVQVMAIGGLALWLAFRPFLWGFSAKRLLLNGPGAVTRRHSSDDVAAIARELDVRGREERLSLSLGMPPPLDSRMDIWVKATSLVPWMILGLAGIADTIEIRRERGGDAAVALIVLAAVALRLGVLRRQSRERSRFREARRAPETEPMTAQG
jgi:hypothetical protein